MPTRIGEEYRNTGDTYVRDDITELLWFETPMDIAKIHKDATPPSTHLSIIALSISFSLSCIVEKPLSDRLDSLSFLYFTAPYQLGALASVGVVGQVVNARLLLGKTIKIKSRRGKHT